MIPPILATVASSALALIGAVGNEAELVGLGATGMGASQVWVILQVLRLRAEWDVFKANKGR